MALLHACMCVHVCTVLCMLAQVCVAALVCACTRAVSSCTLTQGRDGSCASVHMCAPLVHACLWVRRSPSTLACTLVTPACVRTMRVRGSPCACSCVRCSPVCSPGCARASSCPHGQVPHVSPSVPAERLRRHPPPRTPCGGVHGHVSMGLHRREGPLPGGGDGGRHR